MLSVYSTAFPANWKTENLHCFKLVYSNNYYYLAKLLKIFQNGGKSEAWTEVCNEIFGGREMQIVWNLLKDVWRA